MKSINKYKLKKIRNQKKIINLKFQETNQNLHNKIKKVHKIKTKKV